MANARQLLAWILTASVSIGGALRASNQYVAADLCFIVAGLAAVVKSIQVAVDAKKDKVPHRVFYAMGYSVVAMVVTGLVLWGVAPRKQPESAGDQPPVEVPTPVNPRPEPKQPPPEPKARTHYSPRRRRG